MWSEKSPDLNWTEYLQEFLDQHNPISTTIINTTNEAISVRRMQFISPEEFHKRAMKMFQRLVMKQEPYKEAVSWFVICHPFVDQYWWQNSECDSPVHWSFSAPFLFDLTRLQPSCFLYHKLGEQGQGLTSDHILLEYTCIKPQQSCLHVSEFASGFEHLALSISISISPVKAIQHSGKSTSPSQGS